jgi:hypothetical protein
VRAGVNGPCECEASPVLDCRSRAADNWQLSDVALSLTKLEEPQASLVGDDGLDPCSGCDARLADRRERGQGRRVRALPECSSQGADSTSWSALRGFAPQGQRHVLRAGGSCSAGRCIRPRSGWSQLPHPRLSLPLARRAAAARHADPPLQLSALPATLHLHRARLLVGSGDEYAAPTMTGRAAPRSSPIRAAAEAR